MRLLLPLLMMLAWCGCKHEPETATALPCALPDTVSFSAHIVPLFNTYCNTPGCHTGAQAAGNLNLDGDKAYAALMKQGSGYIDTVQPRVSLLYAQMISVSQPMPPTGNLNSCKTKLVLKWIEQKAKNN